MDSTEIGGPVAVHLQEHDRSVGTIKKYTQAVVRFLAWYEREEQAPLQLSRLTPIVLIGYGLATRVEQLNLNAYAKWKNWASVLGRSMPMQMKVESAIDAPPGEEFQ